MNYFILPYEHVFVINGIICTSNSLIDYEEFEVRLTNGELQEMIFNSIES
jgi:sRNA-binding regulator protein Hfq